MILYVALNPSIAKPLLGYEASNSIIFRVGRKLRCAGAATIALAGAAIGIDIGIGFVFCDTISDNQSRIGSFIGKSLF